MYVLLDLTAQSQVLHLNPVHKGILLITLKLQILLTVNFVNQGCSAHSLASVVQRESATKAFTVQEVKYLLVLSSFCVLKEVSVLMEVVYLNHVLLVPTKMSLCSPTAKCAHQVTFAAMQLVL